MNNCRRLTRRDRRRHAAILNGIKDAPGNHNDAHILAYGRPPYPLRESRSPLPGKVTAWLNSPAANQTELDRLLAYVSPHLLVAAIVVCVVGMTLAWLISLGQ